MQEEHIARINELARIARERALTPNELAEREQLRAAYLDNFRKNFRSTIENTVVKYPDGSRESLIDAYKRKNAKPTDEV
ncbi:DUF896 domain-containing protein [Bacillota bacterium Meth-B3]